MNKLKTIEGAIGEHIINQSNVLNELHRLAHRQFPYQSQGFNYDHMTRYYKVFSSSEIDAIAQEEIGLSLSEMYMMGLTLMGTYKNRFSLQSEHEASTEQASRTK